MIIKAIKLDAEGLPTEDSINLEVESMDVSIDNLSLVATPIRVTRVGEVSSTVTFLVEQDFLLIKRMMDEQLTHND